MKTATQAPGKPHNGRRLRLDVPTADSCRDALVAIVDDDTVKAAALPSWTAESSPAEWPNAVDNFRFTLAD
jgi:hypothetical protein